jgi:wyosine [tRNA(Phe)-imidazoG37] synthetase (radical SAM superfamily)
LGRTLGKKIERTSFYQPQEISDKAKAKIEKTLEIGHKIDYLTFVADGEPTLDLNLGREIEMLHPLGFKIAVITNGSLISREDVRGDLAKADWVSLKVDCTREQMWRRVNRPQLTLQLPIILEGMLEFASSFEGELVTETMLVRGLNDESDQLQELAIFLKQLQPAKGYLSVPTRPPAESWVEPPPETVLNQAYQILSEQLDIVECLTGHETTDFSLSGDPAEDILSITAVHPMRQEALEKVLQQRGTDFSIVDRLLEKGELLKLDYRGQTFYMRKLPGR